ncbi:MAG: hypothetical protein ACKVX7_02870 [Planctomycetota bacterium]
MVRCILLSCCFLLISTTLSAQQPVDIIIAVDTSGDMDAEVADFESEVSFLTTLAAFGFDLHVVLIADASVCIPAPIGSGNCPNDENLPAYRHVNDGVASNDALSLIVAHYPNYAASLRPAAVKIIMVVTSDESDMGAASFVTQLLALSPDFNGFQFHAYVAMSACAPFGAEEGLVYLQLAAQTQGVAVDLCGQDIAPFFVASTAAVLGLAQRFIRGDANSDGLFNIGDAVTMLSYLFSGGSANCISALDANDDGAANIGDAIYALSALFSSGPAPPAPFPICGLDTTAGALTCDSFDPCP